MIQIPTKIEIKNSQGKGLGVFAKEKIYKDEIIEISPLIKLDDSVDPSILFDYRFYYPRKGENRIYVVVLGYGFLFNHNNQNNADWRDSDPMTFEFFATRNIEPGEEIFINYGGPEYFKKRPINWL